jgi:hypothetical protein
MSPLQPRQTGVSTEWSYLRKLFADALKAEFREFKEALGELKRDILAAIGEGQKRPAPRRLTAKTD